MSEATIQHLYGQVRQLTERLAAAEARAVEAERERDEARGIAEGFANRLDCDHNVDREPLPWEQAR